MSEVSFQTLVSRNFHAVRSEPQLMQNCGVDVGDVMRMLYCVESQFIGRAVHHTSAQASTGHPDTEPEWVMIATICAL